MAQATALIFTANDSNKGLKTLSEEGKAIQRVLNSTAGRAFETVLVPDAVIEDIIKEFSIEDRVIEIVHFAGHANSKELQFEDGNATADAFAKKIKTQGTVKLVFLNGCATLKQVKFYHEAGVPYVIATSRPVEDTKATWMATQFYQYLTLKRSLKKAMEEVVIDAQELTKMISFGNERGEIAYTEIVDEKDLFEWGLYPNTQLANFDYSLPIKNVAIGKGENKVSNTLFLNNLIFSLESSDNQSLSAVKKIASNIKKGGTVSDNKKTAELLKVLPLTLGIRLRKIVSNPQNRNNDYYRELLFDYVFFFETMLHHTVAVLLAQLWQDREAAFKYMPKDTAPIWDFIKGNRMDVSCEDYVVLIKLLVDWLHTYDPKTELPVFSKQIDYLSSELFKQAADFFFLQKQYFWQVVRMQEQEAIENCFIAQQHINKAFPFFSFILKFTLASIRGINVKNFRHLPEGFENIENMVSKLIVNEAEPEPLAGTLDLQNMMENKTILSFFQTKPEIGKKSLNLFPFIIDRNVFAGVPNTEVDLYLFIGYFSNAPNFPACFHFVSVKDPGKIWRFNNHDLSEVSFLHTDEQTSLVHKHNHLMADAWEFKNYLDLYMDFLTGLSGPHSAD